MERPGESSGPQEGEWLVDALDSLEMPDIAKLESADPAREIILEEYNSLPELALSRVQHTEIVAGLSDCAAVWRGVGIYLGRLVVRQTETEEVPGGFYMLGGSIYLSDTRYAMLGNEERAQISEYAWQQTKPTYSDPTQKTPFVVAPGVLCKDAHVFFRPAWALHELRNPDMVDATLKQPITGQVVSLENSPGKTVTLFVDNTAAMTAELRSVSRIDGTNVFKRF